MKPRRKRGQRKAHQAREFKVLVERDSDGWYVASVPELRGCYTQAMSLATLMIRIREAISLCLATD